MKKILLIPFLIATTHAADLREIGSITITNSIQWDANTETNVIGYNVYLAELNSTNFSKAATVTTNKWRGDSTKEWFGQKIVYVTAFTEKGEESDPSEKVLVMFRAGVPIPPNNIQLYSLLTAAATNALPTAPPPIPK